MMRALMEEPLLLIRSSDKREMLSNLLGFGGLLFFSFFALLEISKANIGLAMMFAGLLLRRRAKPGRFLRDPMVILSCIFVVYLGMLTLGAIHEFPARTGEVLDGAKNWPIRGFFALLVVAFWVSFKPGSLPVLLLFLMLAGFVLRVLLRLDWLHLPGLLHGFWSGEMRASFGFSAVNLGTWSAVVLLGLLLFSRRLIGGAGSYLIFPVRFLAWTGVVALAFSCFLFSQSRTAWGAAVIVIPLCVTARLLFPGDRRHRLYYSVASCVLFMSILFVSSHAGVIRNRLIAESGPVACILSGGCKDVSSPEMISSSVGQHWLLYGAFWEGFRERAVTGWGPGTMENLLEKSGLNEAAGLRFFHFHSSYFNVLIELGIIGFILVSSMFFLILKAAWRGFRRGIIPADLFLFVAGALSLFGLCALTGEPLQSTNGGHVISLIGGMVYGSAL